MLAISGPSDIDDLFLLIPIVIDPLLDDLDTVKIGAPAGLISFAFDFRPKSTSFERLRRKNSIARGVWYRAGR